MKTFCLKLSVLLISLIFPLGLLILLAGTLPSSLNVSTLSQWTPIQSPGVSTVLMSKALTSLFGLYPQDLPDWIQEPERLLLAQIKQDLADNNLQQLSARLILLLERLDVHQKTLQDLMGVILPDLSNWILAHYFTPLLLISLFGLLSVLLFGQWLLRHFYDVVKFVVVLMGTAVAIGGGIWVCALIFTEKSLMFTMIEYFSLSFLLWLGLTLGIFTMRKTRHATIPPPPSPRVIEPRYQIAPPPSSLKFIAKKVAPQKIDDYKKTRFRARKNPIAP